MSSTSLEALLDPAGPVTRLGTGFTFTEGPIWHPTEQYLLFSDMPADVRRRWDAAGVREVAQPTQKTNGMTYDQALNLIVCEHATSSLVRIDEGGGRVVLASHFEGRELNSPNDVCLRSCGSIYFTDPYYGRLPHFGIERPRDLGWQGVFRVLPNQTADADPELLVDRYQFTQPNGLCFSPDESLLYINDTDQANIRVFDVNRNGSLSNGRLFASGIRDREIPGVPDGMKCDAAGNVWVTAPGGLWIYAPDGERVGKVSIPEPAANLHWGGEDWRTLFVCATTSLYALKTRITPRREPFMAHRPPVADQTGVSESVAGAGARAGAGGSVAAARHAIPVTHTASSSPSPSPRASPSSRSSSSASSPSTARPGTTNTDTSGDPAPVELIESLELPASRCALIIQDMQNDVVIDGGAFADSGSPVHCREQNAIANIRRLADACRRQGIPVIHVWFQCPPGYPGLTLNAPLFEGLVDADALVAGTWGAEPVAGLEPLEGDHVVVKQRMSAFEGTGLERVLKAEERDILIETGAWTNMSIEHTARTGADKGYTMIIPEDGCSTMNADWHRASIGYALTNVAAVTRVDAVIRGLVP